MCFCGSKRLLKRARLIARFSRWTAYTNEVIKGCQKHLSGLKARLEDHVDEGKEFGRLKSTLVWPFEEKELKQNIEMLHRFRGIFADAMTAETL